MPPSIPSEESHQSPQVTSTDNPPQVTSTNNQPAGAEMEITSSDLLTPTLQVNGATLQMATVSGDGDSGVEPRPERPRARRVGYSVA
jgi:hypothetical protein